MKTAKLSLVLPLFFLAPGDETSRHAELVKHVRFLASDELQGRESGTPGADMAAQYIAQQFLKLGLDSFTGSRPGRISFDQLFDVRGEPVAGKDSRVEWGTGEGAVNRRVEALSFSTSGKVSGKAHFLTPDAFASKDAPTGIQDAIVVVDTPEGWVPNPHTGGMLAWVKKIQEAGGRGLLLQGESPMPSFQGQPVKDLGLPAAWSGRIEELTQGQELTLVADISRPKRVARNVLGYLPGKDPENGEILVIGAHYDHLGDGGEGSRAPGSDEIHNGADDNASGTAALIEIAARLAPLRGKLDRNILFAAWGAEEMGLLGSAYFVKNPIEPLDRIVAKLNLDMVGRIQEGKLDIGGVGTCPSFPGWIEECSKDLGLKIKESKGAMGFGGSDHLSFYQENIPVLFFFSGLHTDYHKPSDDWDKINFAGIEQVTELLTRLARKIAGTTEPLEFTKTKDPKRRGGGGEGKMAWFGSIPEYGDYDAGVPISGTSPGSPAEKAGFQKGDILTRLGEVEIKTIYDFTYALRKFKPGQEVEVEFTRNGEKKTIKLTLGSR